MHCGAVLIQQFPHHVGLLLLGLIQTPQIRFYF